MSNYERKSLTECREIKACLEDKCRKCDRLNTKSCTHCYTVILRRDVELCISRIESSREYELARDMVRYIHNTNVDCDTCVFDCDGMHPCIVNQKSNDILRRYLDLYGEVIGNA